MQQHFNNPCPPALTFNSPFVFAQVLDLLRGRSASTQLPPPGIPSSMYRDSEQNDIREGRLLHLGYSVIRPSCLKSDDADHPTASFAAESGSGREEMFPPAHAVHDVPLVLQQHPGSVPVTLAGCSCHDTRAPEDVAGAGQLERTEEDTELITLATQQRGGSVTAAAGCKRPLEGGSIAQGSLKQPEGTKRHAGHGFCGSRGSAAMDTLGASGGSAETPLLAEATAAAVVAGEDEDGLLVTLVEAGGSGASFSFPDLGTANLMLQLGHWLLLSSRMGSASAAPCVGVPGGEALCRKGQLLLETAGHYMGRLLGEMEAMMAMSMAAGTLMLAQDVGLGSIEVNDV